MKEKTLVLALIVIAAILGYLFGATQMESNDLSDRIHAFTKTCSENGNYFEMSTKQGAPTLCRNSEGKIIGSLGV